MTPAQKDFLLKAYAAAKKAGHVFPEMAASEAALESRFGTSLLAAQYNNLFGCKQHEHPIYGTHALPTREFLDDKWCEVEANWIVYPSWDDCFYDRMVTLRRLASVYPHYGNALAAKDPETYIAEVSKSWSTDPNRAKSVEEIYDEMTGDWDATAETGGK
jgi:flagellum-specific peptidoglycan hydrolase FlgJ